MTQDNQPSFRLPSVSCKQVTAAFDGGRLSSDSSVEGGNAAPRHRRPLASHNQVYVLLDVRRNPLPWETVVEQEPAASAPRGRRATSRGLWYLLASRKRSDVSDRGRRPGGEDRVVFSAAQRWGRIDWHTSNAKLSGSMLPKCDSQIEAVCADGLGRVLLLQETPPRVELIDPKALEVVASIDLAVEGRSEIAQAWSDPNGSRGEGAALLPGGHLLVAKEKKPAAFIEFGPPHSRSRGLVRGGVLADGERWPIKKGHHRFVALAIWLPDKTLAKTCADFSDLEIGPDGYLYLLSDKSSTIARLDDLPAGGGTVTLLDAWRLGDLNGKPEGLAFTAQGRAIVGLDMRKPRRNLVLLDPAVAQLRGRG